MRLGSSLTTLALAVAATWSTLFAQTAQLQVIHNAADPAASSVDVYLNGSKLLEDFAFRTATPFISAPAGVPLNIGVAAGNSTSAADTLKNFIFTLTADEKYVLLATGVLDPAMFAPNPDGLNTAFSLIAKSGAQLAGHGAVLLAVAHGATDAPTVDVNARGIGTLVNNAPFGAVTDYLSVPAGLYTLDIRDSANTSTVASFTTDLTGLADSAAVVFASGFINPVKNQNGQLFGLFAAFPGGAVVELPVTMANVQIIHNSADPAAASVDIFINGQKALDDFGFRSATPFLSLPAGLTHNIGIAPGSSTAFGDTIATFSASFLEDSTYVVVANGLLSPGGFRPNPDGRSTAFTLLVKPGARIISSSTGNVQFAVLHGATDAPTVDVDARGVGNLINNAAYTDITDYLTVPPASYTIDIKDNTGTVTVASFAADLSGLADQVVFIFASGFLDPVGNSTGKLFGLFGALADGTVVELPVTTAMVQIIHNSADPAASSVDIFVNGEKAIDNFGFRSATPFLALPAGLGLNIGIAPGSSSSFDDTLVTFNAMFAEGEKYIVVANGVLTPAEFEANPDGRDPAFTLLVKGSARDTSTAGGSTQFAVLHGSTDAPVVDVVARGVGTLVNDAFYRDFTDYLTVPPASYTIDIKDSSGSVTVATYTADLSGLANNAFLVFASGFLSPANDKNGPAFGLFAALSNGTVVELPSVTTSVAQPGQDQAVPAEYSLAQNYPNPFNPSTEIVFTLPRAATVNLTVYNALGQEIASIARGSFEAGVFRATFNAAGLPSGTYFYKLDAGEFTSVKKMLLMK